MIFLGNNIIAMKILDTFWVIWIVWLVINLVFSIIVVFWRKKLPVRDKSLSLENNTVNLEDNISENFYMKKSNTISKSSKTTCYSCEGKGWVRCKCEDCNGTGKIKM